MTSHVRHRRQMVAGAALPQLPMEPGELAVNPADLTIFTSATGNPLALVGVRPWAASAMYAASDIVANAGQIYVAKAAVGPKPFDPLDWATLVLAGGAMANPIGLPDGAPAAPALYFAQDPTLGLYRAGALHAVVTGTLEATGPFFAADGSAAAPAYAFAAGYASGMFRPGVGEIAWATAGVEGLRLNATGLGVGLAPAFKLDVAGPIMARVATTTTLTKGLRLEGGAAAVGQLTPAIAFDAGSNTAAAIYAMRYASFGGDLVFATQPVAGGNPVEVARFTTSGSLQTTLTNEGFRVRHDSGFFSIYNAANTTRTGYLQGVAGSGLTLASDVGDLTFVRQGAEAARFNASGLQLSGAAPAITLADAARSVSVFASPTQVDNTARIELYGATHASTPRQAFIRGDKTVFTAAAAATQRAVLASVSGGTDFLVGEATSANSAANRGVIEVNGATDAMVSVSTAATSKGAIYADASSFYVSAAGAPLLLCRNFVEAARVDSDGIFKTGGNEVGWRDLPRVNPPATYTLAVSDRGKIVVATGPISVPSMPAGSVISIYCNVATVSLTGVGCQIYWGIGAGFGPGNRTLSSGAIVTLWAYDSSNWLLTGNGVS